MVDFTIPQIMMTLAGLAYTDAERSIWEEIFCGLRNPNAEELSAALTPKNYATQGEWNLVWGPANNSDFDNMLFVTQQSGTQNYAVVLRGTVATSLESWVEDVATDQKQFTEYTAGTESWVANGFYDGFNLMLSSTSTGPAEGLTLQEYLEQQASAASEMNVYVTGHSQGAGLMPLFLAWVNTEKANWSATVTTAGYGFAPPTAGDDGFASYMAANADSNLYVNPNDIVPRGYAEMRTLLTDDIPSKVPLDLVPVVDGAADLAASAAEKGGGSWAQAGAVTNFTGHESSGSYLHQVSCQHSHFTYLAMLGAPLAGSAKNLTKYKKKNDCKTLYDAITGGSGTQ